MNTPIQCRRANKQDIPEILSLYAQPDLDDGRMLSTSEADDIFNRMAAYPGYAIYVAEADNGIVGTFALLIMDNLAHLGAPSAVIEDVAVAPELQGQGIGRKMMTFALEQERKGKERKGKKAATRRCSLQA
ncbi:GNAT family N-acetyltransferase [Solemya velesiana gill symbiont]|uniref:GNAT family N-acetyltransferase n=1 Tax=Solemya velesiana gill symbiont TaxID=1918948 RepID=UPI0026D65857